MYIFSFSKRVYLTLGAITLSMTALHGRAQLAGEVDIGALIPAAGSDLAGTRPQIQAAFEFGLDKFNSYLADKDAGWSLVIGQGGSLDPVPDSLWQFSNANITLILGPLTSSNLKLLTPNATMNMQLLFSYGSTSPAENFRQVDSIFRFLPDDSNQVPVIVNQMVSKGISHVIVVYRDDAWGSALNTAFSTQWLQNGRKLGDSVSYLEKGSYSVSDFGTVVSTLATRVQAALDNSTGSTNSTEPNNSTVAVFAIGFEEIAVLMEASANTTPLGDVRWFGIDVHSAIVDDPEARDFANQVKYTISTVAADTSHADYGAFKEHLSGVTDEPASYAFAAAETVELLGLAVEQAGSADTASVSSALPMVASDYQGLLGPGKLNSVGDRETGRYEFKQVQGDKFVDIAPADSSGRQAAQAGILTGLGLWVLSSWATLSGTR